MHEKLANHQYAGRQEKVEEFVYEYYGDINQTIQQFPNIYFQVINRRYASIVVPESEKEKFLALVPPPRITIPILYGLNAKEALEEAQILPFQTYPYGELRGKDVVVGIVDTGIDYTNKVFQYEDGRTRILKIWDQTIEGNPPQGFGYGTEYTAEQINQALKSEKPFEIVPSRDENGHGTFIAGVAAGYDRSPKAEYIGGAPDAELLVVKLKPAQQYLRDYYFINEGAYACQSNDIMVGITYLIQEIRKTTKSMVICIAIGTNDGPHDGTNILESVLQELSALRNIAFVSAAGNEANAGHHYSGTLLNKSTDSFEVNIAESESGLELIIWGYSPDKMSVSIRSPIGQIIEKVPARPSSRQQFKLPLEETIVTVAYEYPDPRNGGEEITIRLDKPTFGIWVFTVYADYIVDGRYNAWLPRVDFISPTTRFLQPDPFITVCIPCTQPESIVVGAYDYIDQSIYVASGRGPTRAQVIKPDIVAPGVNVTGPSISGGYTTYVGTGTAAAITAAAVALLFEWGVTKGNLPVMNTRTMRAILIRGATRQRGVVYPNPIEGYGRLNLLNSLALL